MVPLNPAVTTRCDDGSEGGGCYGHKRLYAARDFYSKTVIKLGTKVIRALIIMKGVIKCF